MGYWKPVYVEEDDLMEMTGTEAYELPETGDCTMLELLLDLTNGAGQNNENNPEYSISKIEILHHGNHVIKSFDAQIALFSAFKDMKTVPWMQTYDQVDSQHQKLRIPILAGRFMGDKEYFWRFQDLGDCSIRITKDFTTGSEYKQGTDYLASAKVGTDLIAWKWFGGPKLPAPAGFFKNSLVKEWSPAANDEKQNFKPATGNKWRHIIVQMESDAYWMWQKIAEAQFDENNESPIFWKRKVADWEIANGLIDGLIAETQHNIQADCTGGTRTMIAGRQYPGESHPIRIGCQGSQTTQAYNIGGSGLNWTLRGNPAFTAYHKGVAYQECLLLNLERMFGGEFYESAGKSMPTLRLTAYGSGISTILPRIRVHLEELITPPFT